MARKPTYNSAVTFEQLLQHLLATRSAAELGREFDVGQSTVSRWASGALVPEIWRADAIAQALNKETGEIEAMIVQAKRVRGRPQLDRRVAELEEAVGGIKDDVAELRELLRVALAKLAEPR